jgi:hypothetical protein
MKLRLFAFLHVSLSSAFLENDLLNSFEDVINNAVEQVTLRLENGELNAARQCPLSATIMCKVDKSGEDCEDLVVPFDKCQNEDMTFTFEYCNNGPDEIDIFGGRTTDVDMKNLPQGSMAYINAVPVVINLQSLAPQKCSTIVVTRKVNTCWKMINSSLKIEGWRGDGNTGDYCYEWAFYRRFIKRPAIPKPSTPCAVSGEISCIVNSSGQPCDEYIVPLEDCKKEYITFTFKYCNDESDFAITLRSGDTSGNIDMKNLPVGTMAFIHTEPVDINLNDLLPGKCRVIEETRLIDTCWDAFDASLKIEGWRGDSDSGDYCFSWDFYRSEVKRPFTSCAVSSQVSCKVNRTGQPCNDLAVSLDRCRREDMTFTFKYCNNESRQAINLRRGNTRGGIDMHNLPPGTMAFVHTEPVKINLNDLPPGMCRIIEETRSIDTCRDTIDASLKIEGWRGAGNEGDFCFAWDFYRTYIKRPSTTCEVSASVSCVVEETGQPCDKLIVPMEDCQEEDMTFTFVYCNEDSEFVIDLRAGDTKGDINMRDLPPGTMAFVHTQPVDINLNDLLPGQCRTIRTTRAVDTCWDMIDASLKVEGWRGDGDYCFAWDFYRRAIKRPDMAPTRSPSSSCAVRSEVSCKIDHTDQPCENLIVPLDQCKEEDMTFTFVYCNEETTFTVDLRTGNTSGEINMKNLPPGTMAFVHTQPVDINLNDLLPGQCRTIRTTRAVDTCWDTIDASLKVEGWRGDGDYCFAWDFYRHTIKRPDMVPTRSPTNKAVSCNVSSKVSCEVDWNGQPCSELISPLEGCGKEAVTFTFEYCNNESFKTIDLISGDTDGTINMKSLPPGTMAFTYKRPVDVNVETMFPGECRTITESRYVNTCRPTIEASLKVEGWRGDGDVGDYCFAWDFYKTNIKRVDATPTRSPTSPCDVSASISCVVESTKKPCDQLVVPQSQCSEEDMTFTFEYCSNEFSEGINLREGDTSGFLDMKNLPPGTMSFINIDPVEMNVYYLRPGYCVPIIVTRSVSTCKPTIDASIKIEGWRGDGRAGNFCFAWEFYRSTINRIPLNSLRPTPTPTTRPSSSPSISLQPTVNFCGIPKIEQRARISAIIDSVSSKSDLQNPNSPQSKAREWILFQDTFDSFCPPPCNRDRKDGGIIQRYTIAVFYFATKGDETWRTCGRKSTEVCDPDLTLFEGDFDIISGAETWLEPVSECFWGGLSCREDTQCIDRIEFGKSLLLFSLLESTNEFSIQLFSSIHNYTSQFLRHLQTIRGKWRRR